MYFNKYPIEFKRAHFTFWEKKKKQYFEWGVEVPARERGLYKFLLDVFKRNIIIYAYGNWLNKIVANISYYIVVLKKKKKNVRHYRIEALMCLLRL